MQSPTRKPAKPGEVDEEAAARKPDVVVGDDVFFNHPNGPMSGRVTAAGEHGATIDADGVTHKIKWPHIVGHKRRAPQHYQIAESGEDGHIVTDSTGKRVFLLIPNEAHENPLMAKAAKGGAPFAGRPGLQKKVIVEKSGKKNTHWVRAGQEQPAAPRGKAAEPAAADGGKKPPGNEAPEGSAKVGEEVQFKAGDFSGQGKVTSAGPKGARVKDGSGREHRVEWHEIHTKPNYAPRNEGEDDKSYAKRVVDKMPAPKHLPEDHDKYFDTKGASTVPMENLHSTKTDEENKQGGDNSPKRMEAALHGKLGKRPPITVTPHPTKPGHYNVQDGNGTYTGAKAAGWKHMPVNIVPAAAHAADQKAKEIAKAAIDPADPKYAGLPKKAEQPSNDKWELIKLSEHGLDELKDWLNRGKGVASKAGCKTMDKGPNDTTTEEWNTPGGMLFIAKLKTEGRKGMYRANQKVRDDYGGNWNRLTDIVRCTIAVDSLDDMHNVMKSLDASGMKVAQTPKNRFLKPTDEGYMDVNLVVTLKNGTHAEVQLNIKDMMRAKNDGHPFYETTRVIGAKYEERAATSKLEKEDWHPDDQDAWDAGDAKKKHEIEQKYEAKPAQTKTPREKWPADEREKYIAAYNEQKRIYGKAYSDHIVKYYGGDESKMIKSHQRVILLFGKSRHGILRAQQSDFRR